MSKHDYTRRNLLRLAEAISDGTPVDWAAENEAQSEIRREMQWLRLIQKIGIFNSTLTDGGGSIASSVGEGYSPRGEQGSPDKSEPLSSWGSLRTLRRIGSGAHADVYRAYDPVLKREVALKLVRAKKNRLADHKLFLQEARRLARVRHPNVLVVHGANEDQGLVGLWTDLLEGSTLEDHLREKGAFSPREAAGIGIELCRALAAVHAAGLVHGDVKTSNVMRVRGGSIVLMDFSSVREAPKSKSEVLDAPTAGTPLYMAPELFKADDLGVSSDIYSLGVVLYRLVSHRYPFEAETLLQLSKKHKAADSVPLRDVRPDLPASFVQVVEKAMATDPAERYSSAGEMERALAFSPVPVDEPAWWRLHTRQLLAGIAFLVGLCIAFILLLPDAKLHVDASIFRLQEGNREKLMDGATVSLGDDLFLEIIGSDDLYAYVINADDKGNLYRLYPLPGLTPGNPLAHGLSHRLPGQLSGRQQFWEVSSAGGTETLLLVASRHRLSELETKLDSLIAAGTGKDEASLARLRGIGGLSQPDSIGATDAGGLLREIREMLPENDRDLWIWQFQLKNPVFGPKIDNETEGQEEKNERRARQ